jgi:FMN reductase [NAD(P)H]
MKGSRSALRRVLAERFGEAPDLPRELEGIDALLRIAGASSHRAWTDRPIEPALLRLLCACALSAPSKSHLQQADIVEVRDPQLRARVQALVPSMPWMKDAAALLVFCANGRRFRRMFSRQGAAFVNEHLDGFFNPAVDTAMVMMNFIHAASASGLGCCPISVLRDRASALAALLELPEHVYPVAGLCVGYPAAPRAVTPRLALSATLHVDRFDDRALDAELDDFDRRHVAARRRHALPDSPPPLSWTEEKRRQYASPQRGDWGAFIRAKGFGLG